MDVSVVAAKTDVQRNGYPVIGYGFNSNGQDDFSMGYIQPSGREDWNSLYSGKLE